ncbi:MAG: serine hydrolase [Deltaproteobacteria bacterium]|nr:serine hydrolase [Deltaproteobacteria bacterium]
MTNSAQIIQTMNDAVDRGIFPSAQLLVAKKRKIILDEPFGNALPETIFDIASLTKPISTTTLIMQLVAADKSGWTIRLLFIFLNVFTIPKRALR